MQVHNWTVRARESTLVDPLTKFAQPGTLHWKFTEYGAANPQAAETTRDYPEAIVAFGLITSPTASAGVGTSSIALVTTARTPNFALTCPE